MATSESIPRWRRANLPTQQRRLRHLRSIGARNISVRSLPSEVDLDVSKLDIYFTLHLSQCSKEFYSSEKIKGSLNPTWRSFNLQHLGDACLETALSDFIVRVWRGKGSSYRLILEWHVNLTGLVYIGDKLQQGGVSYRSNTLIFGMFEGYYSEPTPPTPSAANGLDTGITKIHEPDAKLTVDVASLRMAYSSNSMSRIQTVLRAIKQTQASVKKVRRNIEDTLAQTQKLASKKRERELLEVRIKQLKTELHWRTSKMQSEKETHETTQANIHRRDVMLKTKYETLAKDKERLHEKKRAYFDVREDLIKTGAQLVMRRKQLISELSLIYPVVEMQNAIYTICNVKLPNSEDFSGQDETMISVALGYTTHLVQMINTFLDVPLRYPMDHRGSRSKITDHIHDKLADKDREFPLYSKGKEKFQFNYGVYLLNKNIAQLRYYCGLGTTDLRLTLPNLKSLLELRLGVKFDPSTNALAVTPSQHVPLPPNLGGPQKLTSNFNSRLTPRPELLVPDSKTPSRSESEDSKFEQMIHENQMREKQQEKHKDGDVSNLSTPETSDPSTSPQSSQEPTPSEPTKPLIQVNDDPFKASPDEFFEIVQKESDFVSDPEEKSVHEQLELAQDALTEAVFDNAGSREAEDALMNPQLIEQATGGLLHPRNKHLQRPLTEGFDSDVSSTEENINATYGSKFKVWPHRDHPGYTNSDSEHQNSEDDSHSNASQSGTLAGLSVNRCDADFTYPSSATFKTSAMTALPTTKSRVRNSRNLGAAASFTRKGSPKPGDRVKIVSDGRYEDDICDRTEALDSFATFKVKLPNTKKGGKGPRGVLDDSLGYGGDSDQ